jgi:uncharacterized membrane protein
MTRQTDQDTAPCPDRATPNAPETGGVEASLPPAPSGGERIVIWPHRSLGRRGTRVVLGIAAAGLFGTVAWVARPAAVFVLIPAAAVFASLLAAFQLNARRARHMEIIDITGDMIRVMTSYLGDHRLIERFDPHWVRVELCDHGRIENRLVLKQSGRAVSIGECLSPPEREELAAALRDHIARARTATA